MHESVLAKQAIFRNALTNLEVSSYNDHFFVENNYCNNDIHIDNYGTIAFSDSRGRLKTFPP